MSPFTLLQQKKILGISPMRTLLFLRKGPRALTEIAAHCGVSTAAATGMRNALINAGFTEEIYDPDDRRTHRQKLTANGAEVSGAILSELEGYGL